MATQQPIKMATLIAGADLSAGQFRFVTMAADGEVDLSGDGDHAVGVLQNKPAAQGRAAEVAIAGIVKVEAGGTVAAGAQVASGASGVVITAATADQIMGIAITGGASGELIEVLLSPAGTAA